MNPSKPLGLRRAVNRQNLAGDIAGQIAGEEQERVGDFLRFAHALEGNRRADALHNFFRQVGDHVGAGYARRNGVDPRKCGS